MSSRLDDGGGPHKDKKFVQKLMAQLRDGSRELKVVDDKLGTPTYTRDFGRNVRLLLERRLWGLYNMVCQGATSRLEVAQALVAELGLAESVEIGRRVGLLRRNLLRPAARLRASGQSQARTQRAGRHASLADALRDYLRTDYVGYLPG